MQRVPSRLSSAIDDRLEGKSDPGGVEMVSINIGETPRSYLVHLPARYTRTRRWPVVVMFHGGGGTAKVAMEDTGWARKGEQAGFISVFPEGTRPNPARPARFIGNAQSWNDGSHMPAKSAGERGVDDMAFVSALLKDIERRYSINQRRIYATGFSNGASMSFRLARELSTRIAAIAPVAGHDCIDQEPTRAVPVIYLVGKADPLSPFDGGEVFIGKKPFGMKPPTMTMLRKWATIHDLPAEHRVTFEKCGAQGVAFGSVIPPMVVVYTFDGHGHHWPGGKTLLPIRLAGENKTSQSATDIIWNFFKTHRLPAE